MSQQPKTNTDIEHQNVLIVQTKKAYIQNGVSFKKKILVQSFKICFTFQTIIEGIFMKLLEGQKT